MEHAKAMKSSHALMTVPMDVITIRLHPIVVMESVILVKKPLVLMTVL
jgi:hypothetical protein